MPTQQKNPPAIEAPPPPRLRGLAAGGMLALTALVLAALLFADTHGRFTPFGAAQAPSPTPPEGWQTYHDPQGFFTLSLPTGWTMHQDIGSGQEGDAAGSVAFQDYMNSFGSPPSGENSITVWVYVTPMV